MQNERSLSDTISVILIIFMVLVLAIIIMVLVFGANIFQQKSALVVTDFSNQTISGKNVIVIFDSAGDPVYLNASLSGLHRMSINLDNKTSSWRAQPVPGLNTVNPGTTLYIYYNASRKIYQITANPAILQTSAAQAVTDCPLRIRLVDEDAHLLITSWNWTCVPTGPAPTITGISPTTGTRGWPVLVNISGTNYLPGAGAKFNRTGYTDIPATSCTYVSSARISCTFDLLGKTTATYNVVVTNPDGKQVVRANSFVLSSPAPTITSSTPATGAQGATVTLSRLLGTYFQPGAVVVYTNGTTTIPLTSMTVVSATNITGTLVIPSGATVGPYNITVTNTDGKSITRANAFSVTSNAPSVTSITPNTGNRGWPVNVTSLAGARFQPGTVVKLVNSTAGPDITATSVVVNAANTSLTCTFDLTGVPAAKRNITVTNPDGKTGTLVNGFTVNSNAPTITSSTPATGAQGATMVITRLLGTYFQPGAVVVYTNGSTTLPLTSMTVVSATNITGTLVIPSGAPVGPYNITVTNTDGKSITRAGAFSVTSNAPTVTGLSARTGYRGWPLTETITGTNFATGATAQFSNATTLATITATSCTRVSATSLSCTFDLLEKDASATNGYNVVVINPDGKQGMRASYFTLSSPAPTISSSTPSSGMRGSSIAITNLAGNYFQPGAVVTYWRGSTVLSLGSVTVPARTSITGSLSTDGSTPLGAYNITITNTDGKTVTRTSGFTLYGVPAPTISGISPGTGARGTVVPVIVTGTNIVSGARVRLYNGTTSVYLAPAGTVSPTQISTTFTVPATIPAGTMNVRITNPDGQYATLTGQYVLT
jgi:hypothetical protein